MVLKAFQKFHPITPDIKNGLEWLPLRSSHLQRNNYFYFAILENLRIFQNCLFTGGFGNELPQSKPDGFASSLWEGAIGMAGKFLVTSDTFVAGLTACALSVCSLRSHPPLPKGEARALPETFSLYLIL